MAKLSPGQIANAFSDLSLIFMSGQPNNDAFGITDTIKGAKRGAQGLLAQEYEAKLRAEAKKAKKKAQNVQAGVMGATLAATVATAGIGGALAAPAAAAAPAPAAAAAPAAAGGAAGTAAGGNAAAALAPTTAIAGGGGGSGGAGASAALAATPIIGGTGAAAAGPAVGEVLKNAAIATSPQAAVQAGGTLVTPPTPGKDPLPSGLTPQQEKRLVGGSVDNIGEMRAKLQEIGAQQPTALPDAVAATMEPAAATQQPFGRRLADSLKSSAVDTLKSEGRGLPNRVINYFGDRAIANAYEMPVVEHFGLDPELKASIDARFQQEQMAAQEMDMQRKGMALQERGLDETKRSNIARENIAEETLLETTRSNKVREGQGQQGLNLDSQRNQIAAVQAEAQLEQLSSELAINTEKLENMKITNRYLPEQLQADIAATKSNAQAAMMQANASLMGAANARTRNMIDMLDLTNKANISSVPGGYVMQRFNQAPVFYSTEAPGGKQAQENLLLDVRTAGANYGAQYEAQLRAASESLGGSVGLTAEQTSSAITKGAEAASTLRATDLAKTGQYLQNANVEYFDEAKQQWYTGVTQYEPATTPGTEGKYWIKSSAGGRVPIEAVMVDAPPTLPSPAAMQLQAIEAEFQLALRAATNPQVPGAGNGKSSNVDARSDKEKGVNVPGSSAWERFR